MEKAILTGHQEILTRESSTTIFDTGKVNLNTKTAVYTMETGKRIKNTVSAVFVTVMKVGILGIDTKGIGLMVVGMGTVFIGVKMAVGIRASGA